jgi:hypothetical protein
MAHKILSDLISGIRNGIAWGLAVSAPSRLTLWLLGPLAARPAPRPSSLPPCSEVVAQPAPRPLSFCSKPALRLLPRCSEVVARTQKTRVDAIRDGIANLLFLLWHCEMRIRTELHEWKHALRVGFAWGQVYTGLGL